MASQYLAERDNRLKRVKSGLEETMCVHVIPVSGDDYDVSAALLFARSLRKRNVSVLVDARACKLKQKLKFASEELVYFAAIIGESERLAGTVVVRDMDIGCQETMLATDAAKFLTEWCTSPKTSVQLMRAMDRCIGKKQDAFTSKPSCWPRYRIGDKLVIATGKAFP